MASSMYRFHTLVSPVLWPGPVLQKLYVQVSHNDTEEPMAGLSFCSYKAPRKGLNSLGGTQAHLQEIRHPVCRQRGSILVCPALLQLLPDHTHSFLHGDIGEWRGDVKIIFLQVYLLGHFHKVLGVHDMGVNVSNQGGQEHGNVLGLLVQRCPNAGHCGSQGGCSL